MIRRRFLILCSGGQNEQVFVLPGLYCDRGTIKTDYSDDSLSSDDEPLVQKVAKTKENVRCPSTPGCSKDSDARHAAPRHQSLEDLRENSPRSLYYSPSVIRPLPPPCPKKSNRKLRLGKAEILTSTPIKTEQLKKLNTSNAKVKKSPEEMTNKGKQTGTRMKKQRKKNANDTEKEETYCGICGESYEEINGKPSEDWIMCNRCQNWCYEACTAYEGKGTFTCDDCE
ncbi:hypothetical protein NQ318_000545 [Aromia moschata]|uniref:Uncharacterized protein n=1 Tax=Aromia moschata TaxID=1265417 RepID=A0AAV8YHA4_9CUCU|nr:hypothetical protein NQ318_000545 [Aromia moschata]